MPFQEKQMMLHRLSARFLFVAVIGHFAGYYYYFCSVSIIIFVQLLLSVYLLYIIIFM